MAEPEPEPEPHGCAKYSNGDGSSTWPEMNLSSAAGGSRACGTDQLGCPDPSRWLYSGNEEIFRFLRDLERSCSCSVDDLRKALGEKLQTDENWEWADEDWADVDDFVQHYIILRGLRCPPFWDARPLPCSAAMMSGPKPVSLAADSSADCISLPVLVITLKQREDRRRFIDAHLLGSGVSYEYFDATDGSAVDMEAADCRWAVMADWAVASDDPVLSVIPGLLLRSHIKWWHNCRYSTRPVAMGEVGCAISHIRVWEEVCARSIPAATVLEDHCAIDPITWYEFLLAYNELTSSGFDWDIIYLGVGIWLGDNQHTSTDGDEDSCPSSPFFARMGFTYGSSGYVVSARGARRLLATNYERCLFAVDEYLPFMYNRQGHPRAEAITNALSRASAATASQEPEKDLQVIAELVALRYRGPAVLVDNVGSASDIESQRD